MNLKKLKRMKKAPLTWIIAAVMYILLVIILLWFPLLPMKYKLIIAAIPILPLAILAYFTFRPVQRNRNRRIGVTVMNSVLAAVLLICNLLFPWFEKRIRNMFGEMPETETTTINVYAMTTDYKTGHIDIFRDTGHVITSLNLDDYRNEVFITQNSIDQENQQEAIEWLNKRLNVDHIAVNEKDSVWEAVDALYHGESQVLILNEGYVSTLEEYDTFKNFSEDTVIIASITLEVRNSLLDPDNIDVTKDPWTMFIGGNDERSKTLSTIGRTDVNMILGVDPVHKQFMIISLPRDAYIPNPALDNKLDKLTHLDNRGIANTVTGLSEYMDIPMRRYTMVNLNTFKKIVDALDGVDVNNPYAFHGGKYDFPKGELHMDGEQALAYVRERKSLPDGDFGRNEHQTIVLRAILKKMLSFEIISKFNALLESLKGTFVTNIRVNDIYRLANMQMSDMAEWKIISYQVRGTTGSAETASMPGRSLSVVYLNEAQLEFACGELRKLLSGEIVEQKEMP